MGRPVQSTGVLAALFSPVEQRVLSLLFGQPRRRFQSGELMRLVQGGTGGVHRVLTRLTKAELLTVTWVGNQKYYQARETSPIFPELCGMIAKTTGLVEPIEQALRPLAAKMAAAFLSGPIGKKLENPTSEIEVVVISDRLTAPDVEKVLGHPVRSLSRAIVPLVFTTREWEQYADLPGTMVARVMRQSRLFLIGSEEALPPPNPAKWR
jgi:hypothetical protein